MPVLCRTDMRNCDYRIPQFKSCCAWTGWFYTRKVWTTTLLLSQCALVTSAICWWDPILSPCCCLLFVISYKWLHPLVNLSLCGFFGVRIPVSSVYGLWCLCVFVCPSHELQTFDSVCVQPTPDLQLQTLLTSLHPAISWPADTYDSRPYWHLTIQHSLFLFSTNCFQCTVWYWCHYFVFQAPWQRHALHVWYLNLAMQESSRVLVDDKESKKAADQRTRNKLTVMRWPCVADRTLKSNY